MSGLCASDVTFSKVSGQAAKFNTALLGLLPVLLSNRAAARSLADRCMDALSDCERCVELSPTYWRGVKRRADCLAVLGLWQRSIDDFDAVGNMFQYQHLQFLLFILELLYRQVKEHANQANDVQLREQVNAGLKQVENVRSTPRD